MGEFRMPSLGADMDVGTIIEWLVKPGDAVHRGQIVAVVDTAKAAIEIEAFEEGVVTEILVGPGVKVAVGTPLAMIGAAKAGVAPTAVPGLGAGTSSPVEVVVDSVDSTARIDYQRPVAAGPAASPSAGPAAGPSAPPAHPRATPPVRHLAHQLGVDLDAIAGSGPDGHITHDDVLRAAPSAPTAAASAARSIRIPDRSGTSIPDRSGIGPRETGRLGRRGGAGGGGGVGGVAGVAGVGERLRVTPRARRIAAERGVDLADLTASGPSGAVVGADVERAADAAEVIHAGSVASSDRSSPGGGPSAVGLAQPPGQGPEGQGPEGRGTAGAAASDKKAAMRTAIANLMSRSNAEIPHYYVTQTVDLAAALAWLRTHNAALPVATRVLPAALFLRATVLAATAVPDLNGHWVDGALRTADRIDLGVAVATRGGGLVTPAIPDAGPLRIDDLMAALSDLVVRARRGNLRQAEMAGGSITVSSLGETGPDALYGVIFPPQVALVGLGGIVERPWAVGGMLTVRPTVTVVLAADHRASDGRTASAFLATFDHALQNPEEL
jgi:pyruvate dehydrogenase E2 component (dihydrolipoamide acetyltransferase)